MDIKMTMKALKIELLNSELKCEVIVRGKYNDLHANDSRIASTNSHDFIGTNAMVMCLLETHVSYLTVTSYNNKSFSWESTFRNLYEYL